MSGQDGESSTVSLTGVETFYQRGVSPEDGGDRCSNEIMEEGAASDDWITVSLCPGRVSNPEPVPCNALSL